MSQEKESGSCRVRESSVMSNEGIEKLSTGGIQMPGEGPEEGWGTASRPR